VIRFPQLLNPHQTAREVIGLNQKVLKRIESLAYPATRVFCGDRNRLGPRYLSPHMNGWNKRFVSMQPSSFSVSICP